MAIARQHAPTTLEEYLVGALELQSGCAKEAVIPPPSACPKSVHSMYAFSHSHALTILVVVIFVAILAQLTMMAINPNAGGH